MKIFFHLALIPVLTNFVTCEFTKAPPATTANLPTKHSSISNLDDFTQAVGKQHSSSKKPVPIDAHLPNQFLSTQSKSLTKLAKALSLGFDPYFSKDYFEPFERRPRPVTLVAFRKHGALPRYSPKNSKHATSKSSEVAELQSPFNEVSSYWHEDYD